MTAARASIAARRLVSTSNTSTIAKRRRVAAGHDLVDARRQVGDLATDEGSLGTRVGFTRS